MELLSEANGPEPMKSRMSRGRSGWVMPVADEDKPNLADDLGSGKESGLARSRGNNGEPSCMQP